MPRRSWRRLLVITAAAATVGAALILLLPPRGATVYAAGGGATTELSQTGTMIAVPPVFAQQCVECHGADASGSGEDHTKLIPPPANLTLIRDATPMLVSIVKNGIQGTAMPPHPSLTAAQGEEILTFVGNLATNMQREWDWPYGYLDRSNIEADRATGRAIFITACSECHGINGDGQSDDLRDPHIWPKPANFHARSSEIGRLYSIISYGRPGTMMGPQAPKFQSQKARWALAQYVFSLFDANSSDTIPTGQMQQYRNPYNPEQQDIVSRGQAVTAYYCGYCHGGTVAGSWLAPSLIDRNWRYGGGTDNALFMVIDEGIPGKLMPPHDPLPERDRWSAITFIRSRGGLPDPRVASTRAETSDQEKEGAR